MILGIDRHDPQALALIDGTAGHTLTYGQVAASVAQGAASLGRFPRSLVFLVCENSLATVIAYLSCLEADQPVALLEPMKDEAKERLDKCYHPGCWLFPGDQKYPNPSEVRSDGAQTHPALALLLQTSGSTGSPKLVRLTRANLEANARSITEYLHLGPGERAIQSLPLAYSYGLSVVNSHLYCGASVLFTAHSFMRPEFWKEVDEHACTSFAGVPFMYETLERLRFEPSRHPSLHTFTQAGGALNIKVASRFDQACRLAGSRFFVMYGQTEATARISYVPPERLADKLGSIGISIPGGRLELEGDELIYHGPNVMLGYAESQSCLLKGDELQGRLSTGDLARVDEEGYYYLTGRLKRFAKLFGLRINLDEVESMVEAAHPVRVAALEREGQLHLFVQTLEPGVDLAALRIYLAGLLGLTPRAIEVRQVDPLPLTPAGKKNRQALPS